jgi:hypothetical protein
MFNEESDIALREPRSYGPLTSACLGLRFSNSSESLPEIDLNYAAIFKSIVDVFP